MRNYQMIAAAFFVLAMPAVAHAQSGAVSGTVSGTTSGVLRGTTSGVLNGGLSGRPNTNGFQQNGGDGNTPSYQYSGEVRIGTRLPSGVIYQNAPTNNSTQQYLYARVNGRLVLVDPATRSVKEIVR